MEADVVVVGGGPTGLMAARELALAGRSVIVLERRVERVKQSRALTLHPRSLEILSMRGLLDRALAIGTPLPTGHYGILDTRLNFGALDTKCPYTLFIAQEHTERLLEEAAIEAGVDVRRDHRVEGLVQDDDGVTVTGIAGGAAFTARSAYVIGADGARSFVRNATAIDFPGSPCRVTAFLADIVLDNPGTTGPIMVISPKGRLMGLPLGGYHRLIFIDSMRASTPLSEPVTLEEVRDAALYLAGTDYGMRDPLWLSRFGNESRLAASYRDRRIFLAGDAAHMHFPAGGQGLNVGIQDSLNLAWKLAAVLDGTAPDSLLDSYHAERWPVGRRLLDNTFSQTAVFLAGDEPNWALRSMLNDLLMVPEANKFLADQLSAFDVAYDAPIWPIGEGAASPLVGARQPDIELVLENGETTTLYGLMHEGRWIELLLADGDALAPALPAGAVKRVRAKLAQPLSCLAGIGALLIRPDGYIADLR